MSAIQKTKRNNKGDQAARADEANILLRYPKYLRRYGVGML